MCVRINNDDLGGKFGKAWLNFVWKVWFFIIYGPVHQVLLLAVDESCHNM